MSRRPMDLVVRCWKKSEESNPALAAVHFLLNTTGSVTCLSVFVIDLLSSSSNYIND